MWNASREVAPIDIIDVSRRHGRFNNRHDTAVASVVDRVMPSRVGRPCYGEVGMSYQLPVAPGTDWLSPEGWIPGGMTRT